jgi:hypothetical protein
MSTEQSNGNEGNRIILPIRQERMASLLAAGRTKAAAAREARVAVVTIYEWLKNPAFRARVEELSHDLWDQAINRLRDMMAGVALDKLKGLLSSENESLRLEAVKVIYEVLMGMTSAADLKARIEALEANQPKGRR